MRRSVTLQMAHCLVFQCSQRRFQGGPIGSAFLAVKALLLYWGNGAPDMLSCCEIPKRIYAFE